MAKKTHDKMYNIPDHKKNANQIHVKIPPHSCYNGYPQEHKQQTLARILGKMNPHTLLVGM
jgi:UDP-N-acetyl-D-mannosaminuronic acid transferase (WecB/TagA/CpsF family)